MILTMMLLLMMMMMMMISLRQIAFHHSPYADPRPIALNERVVREEEQRMRNEREAERKAHERKLFLLGTCLGVTSDKKKLRRVL